MTTTLKRVKRKKEKMRLCILGERGTGKTVSALAAGYGLCGNWSKVALIDTERGAASYHASLGKFNTVVIPHNYSPEHIMQAIYECERQEMEVIILDSATPVYFGEGGVIDMYNRQPGTSTDKWKESMSYYYEFIETMFHCSAHVIVTVQKENKRMLQHRRFTDGFITVVDLDDECRAHVLSDRTQLLQGEPPFVITPETGMQLLGWCNQCEDDTIIHPFCNGKGNLIQNAV